MASQLNRTLAIWLPTKWRSVSLFTWVMTPIAWVYYGVSTLKRLLYRSGVLAVHDVGVPVIVVGNISTGGTGKTPTVLKTAQALEEAGYRPGIICRGYGGSATNWPQLVKPDSCALSVGDEALLMARRGAGPVAAGPDRVEAAKRLIALGCNVIVSDDGLQHYRLSRDIEVALVSSTDGFGNGRLLPAGPLREPVSRLDSTDVIVVSGPAANTRREGTLRQQLERVADSVQVVAANYDQFRVYPLNGKAGEASSVDLHAFASHYRQHKEHDSETSDGTRRLAVHAVAGIGQPVNFFKHLRTADLDVIEHAFADHHRFQYADLAFADGLPVLMTEKDAVKCEAMDLPEAFCVIADFSIEPAYYTLILKRLAAM